MQAWPHENAGYEITGTVHQSRPDFLTAYNRFTMAPHTDSPPIADYGRRRKQVASAMADVQARLGAFAAGGVPASVPPHVTPRKHRIPAADSPFHETPQ
jgi:hypothetical protein